MSRPAWLLVVAGVVVGIGGLALVVFNVMRVHDPGLGLLGVGLTVLGCAAALAGAWLDERSKW